jgi:hypothetical protein
MLVLLAAGALALGLRLLVRGGGGGGVGGPESNKRHCNTTVKFVFGTFLGFKFDGNIDVLIFVRFSIYNVVVD